MNKYGLHGKLQATEGKADELANILIQAAHLVSEAKGCHLYVVSKDLKEENSVWVTEIWDSKEEHDASLQLAGVRELIGEAIPILAGKPEGGQELEILGGVGVG